MQNYKETVVNLTYTSKSVFEEAQQSLADKSLALDNDMNLVLNTYMLESNSIQVLNFGTNSITCRYGSSILLKYSGLVVTSVAYSSYSSSYATEAALEMLICEVLEQSELWSTLIQHTTHMMQHDANKHIIQVFLRSLSPHTKSTLVHLINVIKQ